jgi:hypothetical protein
MPPRLAPALIAVLVVLVVLGALVAASSTCARPCATGWASSRCAVERVDRLPELPAATKLELGRRVTAAQAARPSRPPAAHGPRARRAGRHLRRPGDRPRARLAGLRRPSRASGRNRASAALLDELEGDSLPYAQKLVAGGVPIKRVDVNGAPGLFIAGEHALALPDELHPRLAGNTLLWARAGVTYRLETALGVRAALRLARSVR